MADKAYEYMDWPRIEAIVYGEEASPRDVMQPRVTEDGVLIQGFFPDAEKAEVLENEYNLNLPRYVDTFAEKPDYKTSEVISQIEEILKSKRQCWDALKNSGGNV